MTDKYIYYEHEGKNYRVPEGQQKEFESRVPSARIMLTYNNKNYGVPISEYNAVVQRLGSDKLTYSVFDDNHEYLPDLSTERIPSFEGGTEMEPVDAGVVDADDASLSRRERRQARREERRNDGETTWWETITNAVGSMGVRTGQLALDLMRTSWNTGAVGGALNFITGKTLEDKVSDENNLITRWTTTLGETADRLSTSADPTAGQKGYVDLIMEGDIKHLAQKALGSGIESLPMMVAAGTGWGALLYGAAMASSQYAEETRENPDIPAWKRASNAIGSAAMEMAVEKLGGPLNDIFKGGKGITEEIAKEILEEAVKEGTEGVAKRIIRVLGKIGKQGVEEGWEEVITSFGNDAIGEALDIIDGNEDYGIRAQWQRLLEENPDASLADFAWAKGREYMDAFIGGAVSGMQISGATTAVNEGVRAMSNPKRDLELAYQSGHDLSYEDLYDVDSTVADAYTAVSDAFAADGESTLSQEFISGLTADEAYALSQREDFSHAQRAAFGQLALAKSQQDGLSSALDERLESSISKNISIIQKASVNGKITTGSVHGKSFFVKGGIVKNGSVFTTEAGTHGPIIVIDPSTGDELVINSSEITSALTSDSSTMMSQFEMNARNYESQNRENSRNTMSVKAKTKASMAFVGKKIMVDLGNGIIEVEVQNVMPQSGEILVKGKKGDLGGQGIVKLPVAQFYDSIYRDENGEPVITETGSTPSDTPVDEGAIPDYRGEKLSILQDGEVVEAEVISQDDAANRIVYKIINKDGSVRTISSTIEEFGKAVGAASNPTPAAPVSTPEAPVEPEVPSPVDVEPEAPAAPIEPEAIDWDTLFESDPEAYFAELKNQFGDDVLDILNEEIEAAQNELDALAKAKTKSQNERLENRKKKQALQNRIDALNGMVARVAPPAAPASPEVAPEVPTAPVTPTVPQGVENVPDFSIDKASEARKRGFRMTNGQRVDRRGETSGVYGKDIEVTFTSESKGKRAGKVKVIEAGNLVPSHIGGVENVYHFLPEAQPKKRTDAASTVSATLIAQNMDSAKMTNVSSSAYEGAPSVNKRGEAIQGNNRAAAIIEMYQAYPEKAAEYKQYLIDHSAELGIDAATVAAMQNPVLVRELDVDDTDAIALGQHTMQDMESGGSQMIDSGRAIAGLSNKGLLEEFIARLLAEENEEASDMNLNDLITRNGNDAIKMLYHNGIINQTQYQSALGPNGKVTADARAALRGIIEQQLFANGIDNLSVMFEVLPDKAKKAIMQTIARDLKNTEDSKVTPYIQEAIEIYYQLNKLSDFVSAKTDAEIDSAIESFKAQTSLDQDGVPAEKYTNFAFVLARNFKAKTQKQQRELLNYLYDTIEGTADIFGESEGKSLGEAVAEVYNTNLNKAKDETNEEGGTPVLEGGTGEGPEGRQGSTGGVGVRPTTGEGGQGAGNGGTDTTFGGGVGSEGEVSPKAPKPVDNPVAEAQKKEKSLAIQLKRIGIPHEQKQDMAFNAGKAVADFFATREEYDAYAENATDFGEYNADFERGVDASFANRPQNNGVTTRNSVPLGNEPKGEDNGGKEGAPEGGDTNGPAAGTDGGGTDNGGSKEGDSGDKGKVPPQGPSGSESGKESEKVKHQYPARKRNVTGKILIDTFGLANVDIPDSRKPILNAFYDFMMEMAKTLGISPKSIGNGGWLTLGNLRANAKSYARHAVFYTPIGGNIVEQHLFLKYSRVSSIAHEWWHSLDHALGFFESGKHKGPVTEISYGAFDGRKEVLDAVRAVMQAIKDSGYTQRIQSHPYYSHSFKSYVLEPTESAARAFAEYIKNKFDEQGIVIAGVNDYFDDTQPTAEEMELITPTIENLFNVLQEKEGKKPGTSILYQIGEDVDKKVATSSDTSEVARRLANEAIDMMFEQAGREVVFVTDEQAEQMRRLAGADAEFMIASDKPVFVSNAAVAVMGIKQEKATPAQWLAMIEKAGGLKAGEDKWMGLSDWLKESDKKTLTKQDVLDYIVDNTIRIEEIHYVKGGVNLYEKYPDFDEAFKITLIDAYDNHSIEIRNVREAVRLYNQTHEDQISINDGDVSSTDRKKLDDFANEFLKEYEGKAGNVRKIQPSRLPHTTFGLENKREIALVVPTVDSYKGNLPEVHFFDAGEGRAVAWVRFGETYVNEEAEAAYEQARKDEQSFRAEMEQKYGSLAGGMRSILTEEEYAHYMDLVNRTLQLDDSRKKSGKRVLVIDEVQSQRHQDAREKDPETNQPRGYRDDAKIAELREKENALLDAKVELTKEILHKYGVIHYLETGSPGKFDPELQEKAEKGQIGSQEQMARMKELDAEIYATINERYRLSKGIPYAPFEKNWHELVMKRMLRYAAENGYDAVAWTKGEQQADRYGISKVAKEIYVSASDVERYVSIKTHEGDIIELPTDPNSDVIISGQYKGNRLSEVVGEDMANKIISIPEGSEERIAGDDLKIGGEGMKGFYDKMLPAFMNKYGKKWGIKVADITLPNVEEAGRVMHSVPVTDAMKESVIEGQVMFMKRPNGKVFGWTDGKKIYLTKDGLNPNTKIHEYTHLWAQAMMQKNPKGWQSVKDLLRGTPVWNEVLNDPNYSNIHADEDLVASEVLSRISGRDGSAKLERMAQQMVDEAKGSMRKLEARGLVQRIKDALNEFWNWVGTELFSIEKFDSVEQVTDRVLWDLMNATDLGELSEGQIETQIVTDPKVIAELEASPKRRGYRTVIKNKDKSYSSPMAFELQRVKGGKKTRVKTTGFEKDKWEVAQEHPELVDENGQIKLVKPNENTLDVAYDPYIHNRLEPVNLQFKDAWKRYDLIYIETEVAEVDLESGYHAERALLPVGVHPWSNGELMLSRYDKPVKELPWDEVADAFVKRLNGEGIHFDVVSPQLRKLLVDRGVEILPPHTKMGKDCFDAYDMWKENPDFDADRIAEASNEDLLFRSSDSPITPEMDAEYLAAVERGDMETAQRMVLEAAKLAMPNTKVVDENGNPKVVYHGSPYGNITYFDRGSHSVSGLKEFGTYFSTSKAVAQLYARARHQAKADVEKYEAEKAKLDAIIFDPETSARVILDAFDELDRLEESQKPRVYEVFLNIRKPKVFDAERSNGYDGWRKLKQDVGYDIKSGVEAIEAISGHNRAARMNETYDGIIARNMADVHSDATEDLMGDVFLVFDENPNQIKSAEPVTYDDAGNVIPLSERFNSEKNDIRYRKAEAQNAAVDYLAGEPRLRAIENAVNEEASKLGVKVTYKTREQMPNGHQNDKGYYDPKTGEVVVCTENATSVADAIQTILHEAVAHMGLRQLMGDKFNEFINRVYESLDAETKAKVDALAESQYNGNKAVAMEEYMATLAESTDFKKGTLWDKIKSIFEDIINAILGRNDIKIGDNELRYILRASYNNMVNPRGMNTMRGWARDLMMREEYGIGMTSDEIAKLDAEYMKAVEEGDMETAQRLVLEAAKRAMPNTKVVDKNGAPKVVYHGSPNVFYKFGSDSSVKRAHTAEDTHFFVDDMEVAQSYGKELYPVFLNLANPIVKDFDGNAWNQYAGPITPEELKEWEEERKARKERIKDLQEKIEMLKTDYEASIDENDIFGIGDPVILQEIHELESELNMATLLDRALSTPPTHTYSTTDKLVAGSRNTSDGAIFKNVTDAASPELIHKVVTDYVAYDPSQIKSAAPVTYDDNGNVIPLSLRFNLSNDDIRYRTGINPEEVSAMSAKEVYESVVDKQWQEFQREMQDAYQPVRIAIDAIQQETGNIPIEDYENYLLVQNHSSSRSRAEIDEFERKYYAPIIVQVKTMIDSIMKARKLRLNDKKKRAEVYAEIRQYLIAKHGLERNHYYQAKTGEMKDYSGLTSLFGFDPDNFQDAEAEAERCIKSFETMFGRVDGYDSAGNPVVNQGKEINRLWDKINAATDKTLRHSYESGMISRQQYDDIRSMFEFYIPLRGFDEQTAEDVYDYARFEGNRFSQAVMKAKGRKSVANDPLAYILNMAESEIMQGNRNKAKQALYHFVFNRTVVLGKEDGLMQIESVWYYKNVDADGNVTYVMAAPDKAAGETYEQFEERMKKLEESGDAVRKKGKVDIGMRFQKPADLDAHYVFLNINGEEKAVYINGNPKAADAVNGRFFKTKSEFVEKYGKVNRFLSSVFTNYSIEFTFRNLIRDAIYSRINISQKESPAYRLKFRKNWWKHNFIAMAFLASRYRNGKLEKANLNETERAFVEFMKNGGETGYVVMNKVENQKAALEKEMTRLRNGLSNGGVKNSSALNLLFGWIELINQASELATRFAAFKTSRDMGRSTLLSVRDAKEITVNFNTKGAQDGKGWAGVIASYFGWSKYFFNASVQGVQNVKAMADANKLKFCGTVGSIIAAGFFMPVITSIISQLFGGDDDEEYWNIPEYDRHNNLCIVIGDKRYIKIPLPVGFREMFAIGDMVSAMHFDKKFSRDIATVGKDIANKIASIVLPINPLEGTANGLSFLQTFAYTTLPSSFQVVIQNMTNTDWRGAPLQKEYTYNENDPKWMKAFNSNPDWMKGLSKWCNENINIDGDFKGWDWSPEKLDNTLSNLLGGIYTLIKDTGNTIAMAWNEDKKSIANVPVAGTLVGSGLDSDERFMTDAYYDMLDYYNSQVGYIKRTAEKFGYDLDDVFKSKKGAHHPKMSEIYGHDDFTFMSEWYKRDKKLKDKYDKVKEQRNKIASKKNPTQLDYNRLERLTNKYLAEQRDMVNFMLELD